MTAMTKEAFMSAAVNALSAYPGIAQHVQAGDPRVLAPLAAQATMLAMLSAHTEVANFEPFVKSRDGTVLADAALKGILPLGRAAKVTLTIENKDAAGREATLGAQRRLLDQKGRIYELDSAITLPPGETRTVGATQVRRRSLTRIIADAKDFHSLPVNLSADDLYLNTLVVHRGTEEFTYAPDWFNVGADENCYQVETDELRRMWVKFGKSSVIGYGVKNGDEFTLEITECNGRIVDLAPGGRLPFPFPIELSPPTNSMPCQPAGFQCRRATCGSAWAASNATRRSSSAQTSAIRPEITIRPAARPGCCASTMRTTRRGRADAPPAAATPAFPWRRAQLGRMPT